MGVIQEVNTAAASDAPPPYTSPSPTRPKSSFFKALTSSLRSKPDPLVSALCHASSRGDEQQILNFISQGINIHGRNEDGNTPLKCAMLQDQAGAARILISAGATTNKLPPLFKAAGMGSLNVAKMLLDTEDVNAVMKNGQPCFVEVVNKGNLAGVRFLLENGAKADATVWPGGSLLAQAVRKGQDDIVDLLVVYGADVNSADIHGNSVLNIAIEEGNAKLVGCLLEQGAQTQPATILCTTVLEYTINKKRLDILRQLVAAGVDLGLTDVHNQPILIKVIRNPLLKPQDKLEVIRILLDNGADPDTTDIVFGLPALCHAVETATPEIVEELLTRGAQTKIRMLGGQTMITYSIDVNHRNHIKSLLSYDVDVDEVDGLNRTPLMLAILRLDFNMAKMFMDHGADPSAEFNEGAIDFIKALKRRDFLEILGLTGEPRVPLATAAAGPSRAVEEAPDVPPPSYEVVVGKV
ncbi:ankyrin repeat-containing domain protein [Fusarium flagelliforme]|uniref:ankyrin repeat-containing domain protein n=1 Tax=Fusarium flagelliforme TaxID=2675880 RepID=UPI001E8DC37E|nr:ankyrin repeat-containing domain protein [Fusarium flagelliforme]KAH7184660.1 ankyrin repeat-containing domain protein [Fusarium flagelliforme]